MTSSFLPRLAAAGVVLTLVLTAHAAPRPDPADPRAPVPPLAWRSALDDYRRASAPLPERSWREANDTVGRIGGWRAYAREAQGAAPAAPTAPGGPAPSAAPTAPPAPAARPASAPAHRH